MSTGLLFSNKDGGSVSGDCIWTLYKEHIRESMNRNSTICCRTTNRPPTIIYWFSIPPKNGKSDGSVGLIACGQDDHIYWMNLLLVYDAIGSDFNFMS